MDITVIDSRGKLFGHFNLIDAIALVLFAAFLLTGGLAYTSIRIQPPIITAVVPSILTPKDATRVRLDGRHFRPFLNAFVARRGDADSVRAARPAQFLIGTATAVELLLPLLDPGTYDIHLYDRSEEVARRESAFSVRRGPS